MKAPFGVSMVGDPGGGCPAARRSVTGETGRPPTLVNVSNGDGRLTHDLDPLDHSPQDACGVFGVWAPGEEVSKLTYFGLYALQHRGQESAGIAVSDGARIVVFKDMGLVAQVFEEPVLNTLRGHIAI